MSLTSYRAAPSRGKGLKDKTQAFGLRCLIVIVLRFGISLEDQAATYSPVP